MSEQEIIKRSIEAIRHSAGTPSGQYIHLTDADHATVARALERYLEQSDRIEQLEAENKKLREILSKFEKATDAMSYAIDKSVKRRAARKALEESQ